MKFASTVFCLFFILFITSPNQLLAQVVVRGTVIDANSGDPLINATVVIKGSTEGTVTDFDGKFSLETRQSVPMVLQVSYIGYSEQEVTVSDPRTALKIQLLEDAVTISTVEVKGRRISERQQQSALTVETLDNIAIRETPAANFYDGLGSLKEVDLTAASLGFKIINTRGFNSTSPVRSLQLIDGVDNQSPGLNFSLGNFLGASELDVNAVNLIIGAASAFYGPNAFNGVISMESKDPYLHTGLSAMMKVGERNLIEGGFRWAQTVNNKEGLPFMAYKINFFHFRANDWVADNYDPVYESPASADNPGGYDAVNVYGDEYLNANDLSRSLSTPGLGIIHRRGYREIDLVDYDSDNTKIGAALHFRLNPAKDLRSTELIAASNFSTGTTVYQGDNRFSLRDIRFYQHRLELRQRDKFFLRAYVTHEDAGNSYDPYFTALLLQNNAKKNNDWRADYINYWQLNVNPQLRAQEGYPNPLNYIGRPDEFRAALNAFLGKEDIQALLGSSHSLASAYSLAANPLTNTADFFEPGTQRFQDEFNRITSSLSYTEGGTRFYDKSALAHVHGEYRFNDLASGGNVTDLDVVTGANFRQFMPDSRGSILLDTNGRVIRNSEIGLYGGAIMEIRSKLKINASIRLDKNQNFDPLLSPAASAVYTHNPNTIFRLSFSSAIRNPTLSDQYLFYNVGRAILIGNLDGFQDLLTVESLRNFVGTGNSDTLDYFDIAPVRPERVRTMEAGVRTTLFDRLYVDATYYYSFYRDFIGFNFGVDATIANNQLVDAQAYRVAANATDRVTTQGFSLGLNYYFAKFYVLNANYSWNILNTQTDDPIIPAFNTPEHKFNFGVSGRDIDINLGSKRIKNVGFNVNYKWVEGFLFEGSPQFTGFIPSYDLLDAQVNWRAEKLDTTFKLGASNVLNNQVFQTYGGPRIGRLAYFSILYEFKK